jgi:rieske iron-sulfur protein
VSRPPQKHPGVVGDAGVTISRRAVLKAAVGMAVALNLPRTLAAEEIQAKMLRPQAGDILVFAGANDPRAIIRASSLTIGGAPVFAWPMDPRTMLIRDGTRLNRLLVLKFDPAMLSPRSRANAAGGVVAYSAVCTHEGCPVTEWLARERVLECPCHGSQYNPADGANVVRGPTRYGLANLPLREVNGALVAAGRFIGRLGAQGA